MEIARDKAELSDQLQKTYYILGAANYGCGRTSAAKQYFDLAYNSQAGEQWDMAVRSLLGQASCYANSKEWADALALSKLASGIASKKHMLELEAEALMHSSVCLLHMDDERADTLLQEAEFLAGRHGGAELKRKIYREYLLAASDSRRISDISHIAMRLKQMLSECTEKEIASWQFAKDSWAIDKAALLKGEGDPYGVASKYADSFESYHRYKDAAEVLSYGADLLEKQGDSRGALKLLRRAFDLQRSM